MNKTKLGTNLANRRRELGLKQEEVANKINVSSKTISKWERGVSSPDISFWKGLADVLKIDLYEFVGYGEEKKYSQQCP
ncbi:helix-turn-helix domain-containing protein [Faecalicatena contorta]|uniref:Helix-turn-helix n=1 Tax=Faecalicatena contorta TaxID=39482 RepID=A0A315ZYF8_9FIRM|nr:helix-turn-helix transcriptional regulator [Faecalicatena contorta]PWJ50525.1 helix-turn-helix protein [Faecalicatena contorta]SUQ13933.1 Helix-turn-helix [Faecalicatena contorta]